MPHQCVRCGNLYEDGAREILHGCSNCPGRMFFYISDTKYERLQKDQNEGIDNILNLSTEDKKQIEADVYDILGEEIDTDKPVVLDIESIRILKPGQYELDLVNLFKRKEPLVYKLQDGKYMIDLMETFKKLKKK